MPLARITTRPDQMDGAPCIRGLRIPVATIVRLVANGVTTDEILDMHPELEPDDIREALLFAAQATQGSEYRRASNQ
jgi:uncharacterized protein (DUF433 family)